MLIKNVDDLKPVVAGDRTLLKELLHPGRDEAEVRYSLAHAVLAPGERSLRHSLTTTEAYFFLGGKGIMRVGGEEAEVQSGHVVLVPSGETQCVENTGDRDLAFLCIVDPAWQEENERIDE